MSEAVRKTSWNACCFVQETLTHLLHDGGSSFMKSIEGAEVKISFTPGTDPCEADNSVPHPA